MRGKLIGMIVAVAILAPLTSSAQPLVAMIGPTPTRTYQPNFRLDLPTFLGASSSTLSLDDQHWINRFVTWIVTNPATYSVTPNAYWLSGMSVEFMSRYRVSTGNVRVGCGFAISDHFAPGAIASITYEVF